MRQRAGRRARQFIVAMMLAIAGTCPAFAQGYQPLLYAYGELVRPLNYLRGKASPYFHQKTDFFGGIDAAKAVTFAWAGVTYAPIGTLIEDGWRVRIMGGAGRYTYQTSIVPTGINDASVFSGEFLGGYRKTFDQLFGTKLYVSAFAGLHYEDQMLLFADPFNPERGSEAGIKGTLELYTRLWQRYIVSTFATASTVHGKYNAKGSLLYEFNETWALGGEVAALGDARYNEYRAGLAGSLTWQKKIFILSIGALDNSGRGPGGYATLSVYSPF